jgi:hypothetical protein
MMKPGKRDAHSGKDAMNRRTWKWAIVAANLGLVLLGIHVAWERHRYRLATPKGTIWVGMTKAEVEAVLGPAGGSFGQVGSCISNYDLGGSVVSVGYGANDVAAAALWQDPTTPEYVRIPRPSLVEHVRSWFTGKREE